MARRARPPAARTAARTRTPRRARRARARRGRGPRAPVRPAASSCRSRARRRSRRPLPAPVSSLVSSPSRASTSPSAASSRSRPADVLHAVGIEAHRRSPSVTVGGADHKPVVPPPRRGRFRGWFRDAAVVPARRRLDDRSMRSIPSAVLATALLSLLPTAAADAKDYCVAKPRCTGPAVAAAQLQAALTEAQSNGTADRFFLGDAVFAAGPYSYRSSEAVEIDGVSGTTLQSKVDDRVVLTVDGAAATRRGPEARAGPPRQRRPAPDRRRRERRHRRADAGDLGRRRRPARRRRDADRRLDRDARGHDAGGRDALGQRRRARLRARVRGRRGARRARRRADGRARDDHRPAGGPGGQRQSGRARHADRRPRRAIPTA